MLTSQSCLPHPPPHLGMSPSHPWLPSPLLPHSHLRALPLLDPLPYSVSQHASRLTERLRLPRLCPSLCALTLVLAPPDRDSASCPGCFLPSPWKVTGMWLVGAQCWGEARRCLHALPHHPSPDQPQAGLAGQSGPEPPPLGSAAQLHSFADTPSPLTLRDR